MKLAMYRGPATEFWHKVGHAGTCLWTGSIYSHCELVFGPPDSSGKSLCASASPRDGGVRFKWIDLSSGHWDVYELPEYDSFDEDYAYGWFKAHEGKGYDHFGIVWFVLPVKAWNSPSRYFCSEAVAHALRLAKPHKLHPQKLLETVAA